MSTCLSFQGLSSSSPLLLVWIVEPGRYCETFDCGLKGIWMPAPFMEEKSCSSLHERSFAVVEAIGRLLN
ncbi:hypothetical protein M758_6G148800 [Ceratodon purpureus]|nr:hypothetical protein M758_6G148800 [Ceratodon purpureus]